MYRYNSPYVIRGKLNKENLNLKDFIIINRVKGWFEIMEYNDNV